MSDGAKKNKSVRLSVKQLGALELIAKKERRDLSQVIRIAVDEFLVRNPVVEPPKVLANGEAVPA
jgi:hypothetical protein